MAKTANAQSGFSLLEILIVVTIACMMAAIAIPSYTGYVERAQIARAIADIGEMQLALKRWETNAGNYPATLAVAGLDGRIDPWGNPYYYLRLDAANAGASRKNRNLVPINSDYDLYSAGKDGATATALTAQASRDDVVRANDGSFIGVARDY